MIISWVLVAFAAYPGSVKRDKAVQIAPCGAFTETAAAGPSPTFSCIQPTRTEGRGRVFPPSRWLKVEGNGWGYCNPNGNPHFPAGFDKTFP